MVLKTELYQNYNITVDKIIDALLIENTIIILQVEYHVQKTPYCIVKTLM